MVDFIDTHRSEFGFEPICALLPIAPSSYYDAKSRPVSVRARRHVGDDRGAGGTAGGELPGIWGAQALEGRTDLTVAPTRTGAAYVCLIVDAFSRIIVGWRVAAHMRTEMVLDAIEMARRSRGAHIEGLTVHSDAGSQVSSPPSATPSASPSSARCPRWAQWATHMTTHWLRPSSASTRAN